MSPNGPDLIWLGRKEVEVEEMVGDAFARVNNIHLNVVDARNANMDKGAKDQEDWAFVYPLNMKELLIVN